MGNLYAIYFSATDTTRRCVEAVCEGFGCQTTISLNLADDLNVKFPEFTEDDIVVTGAPVYGGRLPEQVANAFSRLQGQRATAIALVVYGNRDYDDALLELTDILDKCSFRIVGAAAFIGQHSIFPKVGISRPDASDVKKLIKFGQECKMAVTVGFNAGKTPYIKGKSPYKKMADAPLYPKIKLSKCIKCGRCAEKCPVQAIPADSPYVTNHSKCIKCGRCIFVCHQGARCHSGLVYSLIGGIFKASFSKRKEPVWKVAEQ